MSDSVDDQNEVALTEAQSKKLKDWNKMVRQKHSVPENYCVMIDRANIDLVINNESKYENIPVYDEWNTLCNCSFGVITPICSEKYEGGKLHERVARWKDAMRDKYNVPEEYEIIMCYYGESNDIDHWIANCEQKGRVLLKDRTERVYAKSITGELVYLPERDEYLRSLKNTISSERGKIVQENADTWGHFIQIVKELNHSSWAKYPQRLKKNMNHDGKVRADMPTLEQTAFALLYTRQLVDKKDDLLCTTANLYSRFSSNREKSERVQEIKSLLMEFLRSKPRNVEVAQIFKTNEILLKTFQYGGGIVHSPIKIDDQSLRDNFKTLYLHRCRVDGIFELNHILKEVLYYASQISNFLCSDLGEWINNGKVLAPDVMWQGSMFSWEPLSENKIGEEDVQREPVFGVPYDVEISEVQK